MSDRGRSSTLITVLLLCCFKRPRSPQSTPVRGVFLTHGGHWSRATCRAACHSLRTGFAQLRGYPADVVLGRQKPAPSSVLAVRCRTCSFCLLFLFLCGLHEFLASGCQRGFHQACWCSSELCRESSGNKPLLDIYDCVAQQTAC